MAVPFSAAGSARAEFFYLFTLAFAAQLAIIGVARLGYDYPQLPAVPLLVVCVLQGWALLFVPYLVLEWSEPHCLTWALCALPAVALAAAGFYVTQPSVRDCPQDRPRWLRQAANGRSAPRWGWCRCACFDREPVSDASQERFCREQRFCEASLIGGLWRHHVPHRHRRRSRN